MSTLTILRDYARTTDLSSLPPTILFTHRSNSLSIFDKFPKAKFHFLVLPRLAHYHGLSANDLSSLQSLLSNPQIKDSAKSLLDELKKDGQTVKEMIEQEMMSRFGYKWDVWMGFHAVPSVSHLHLHVISSDLCSPSLKSKKHYNSFHPKLGFFLGVDEVLSWFEAEPSFFDSMAAMKKSQYEPLLKEDLSCWRCHSEFKTIPKLKAHLQEEWDNEAKREKAKLERKRKRRESTTETDSKKSSPSAESSSKRREIDA